MGLLLPCMKTKAKSYAVLQPKLYEINFSEETFLCVKKATKENVHQYFWVTNKTEQK